MVKETSLDIHLCVRIHNREVPFFSYQSGTSLAIDMYWKLQQISIEQPTSLVSPIETENPIHCRP